MVFDRLRIALSVRPNSVCAHKKSKKMPQCIKILFHIYMKLNMFWATHRLSSGP